MKTSQELRRVWHDYVWSDQEILQVTDKVIEHDLTEEFQIEFSNIRYKQKTNFFGFRIRRQIELLINRRARLGFPVDISYTLHADAKGENYNKVIDVVELLQEVVINKLGLTWQNSVEAWTPQSDPASVIVTTIGNERVFRAEYSFFGIIGEISIE
jgi:hypothetical protein